MSRATQSPLPPGTGQGGDKISFDSATSAATAYPTPGISCTTLKLVGELTATSETSLARFTSFHETGHPRAAALPSSPAAGTSDEPDDASPRDPGNSEVKILPEANRF